MNKNVVSRAWKAFQTTGIAVRKVGGGCPRTKTAEVTDISSYRRKEDDGSQQASLLSNSQQQRGDKCRGLLRPDALDNCQWSRVLFTDESRFNTRSDFQRVLIWREIGTRFYTSNNKERHHYGGPGVLVWGSIMLNG
ncbi:transposable element Tcb2 transposase [Trichonephila clavipes]|nr:transposable element Tcb2 transposase [Trichonephila clavipes]